MNHAQIGLLVAAPLVLAVAARLYSIGALGLSAVIAIGAATFAITTVLFFS